MLKLNFVTPERKVLTDVALKEITIPTSAGEINVLDGHAPLMTLLSPGILKYQLQSGVTEKFAISWGYCEISPDTVNVLAEEAVKAGEVDKSAATKAQQSLETKLSHDDLSEEEWEKTRLEIDYAKAKQEI